MSQSNIKLYGTEWCSDCKRSKRFLGEQRIRYEFINIEENPEGQAFVQKVQNGGLTIPTIVFDDGSLLIEPTNAELAAKLGLQTKAQCEFYDLITVGGGPTALTTAIYAARDGYDVLVIERSGLGGQAGITERLDNYPGFPEGVTGAEFAERIIEQAKRYGVELLSAQNVVKVGNDGDAHFVETDAGHQYRANAILLATGSTYKRLGVSGEDDYIGAGVHFCATCDGPFYKGKEVVVVGSGNSAVEEAAFLTRFCPKVTILARSSQLNANKIAVDKALTSPQIEVRFNTEVVEFKGANNHLTTVVTKNNQTGETDELNVTGVFVFIGLTPNSHRFKDVVRLDSQGFIMTGIDFQTSTEGIFAAGDVRSGSTKQLVSAAGEGAAAALAIREHLRGHDARSMEVALVGSSRGGAGQ
ncbi:MAG TPA: FAD-dependent oxidoreductase [Ktedonobacteraceae bacterium]|jgi:thioredoxin reductase (NADPH)|nr:FAD-dependent oxidoreductase [Ktedonobacteraceae bacterium]